MKKSTFIGLLLLGWALSPGFLGAQEPSFAVDRLKPDIDAIVNPVVEGGWSPGMVVGVIDQGQTRVWGYGSISSKNAKPPTGDTEFEIASITKLFTKLLFSDVVHRGKMGLEDRVQAYLPPGVKMPVKKGREITLLMLSNHTSGLPCWPDDMGYHSSNDPAYFYSMEELYRFLNRYQLKSVPGETFRYSCLGVALLGNLIARKNGATWVDFLQQRILDSLELRDTGVVWTPEEHCRVAEGYNGEEPPPALWGNAQPTFFPEGSLHSTVNDLLKLAAAGLDPRSSPLSQIAFDGTAAQLDWGPLVSQQGWSGDGFNSSFYLDRKTKTALVVWGRCDSGFPCQAADRIWSRLSGRAVGPISFPRITELSLDQQNPYVGRYQIIKAPDEEFTKFGMGITLFFLKGRLTGQGPGWWNENFTLFPTSDGNFYVKRDGSNVLFHKDAEGKVVDLEVTGEGGFTAEKVGYKGPGIKDEIPPPP